MSRRVAILVAVLTLVVTGVVHGLWANRWGQPRELEEALARLPKVPMTIGDWRGKEIESSAADADVFARAGAQRWWTRSYSNPRHKSSYLVILMCGRAGRMSVHTPEVCYQGAGFVMDGDPAMVTLKGDELKDLGTFWNARFSKPTGVAADMNLFWAWNNTGLWQAASNPRWEFRGQPFLYKLYVSRDAVGRAAGLSELDQEFLRELLPELRGRLFEGIDSK